MSKRYNEEFISLMEKLNGIMMKHGEPFRAKAYQKAQDTIMTYPNMISSIKQLEGLPGIGPTIMEKLKEYVETGTLRILEQEKTNPINILTDVYGIGPKKAEELVKIGIKTIADLRKRQDELLNDIQKIGLEFYEDILARIPRKEIEEYNNNVRSLTNDNDSFWSDELKQEYHNLDNYYMYCVINNKFTELEKFPRDFMDADLVKELQRLHVDLEGKKTIQGKTIYHDAHCKYKISEFRTLVLSFIILNYIKSYVLKFTYIEWITIL
jgi:predicted flap endonuclease-1-like 5' DNA nuclease